MMFNPYLRTAVLVAVFGALAWYLAEVEAFEWFYEYSRDHEDWELDELAIAALAVLFFAVFWFALAAVEQTRRVREASEARVQAEQTLAHVRRAQAIGTLAAGLAHSGNNLLQPILTLSRVSRTQVGEDHPAHEALGHVVKSAEDAKALFATVLRAGAESERNAPVSDLRNFVDRQNDLLSIGLPTNVRLSIDGETGLAVGIGEGDLTDLLLVLVSNAADSYGGQPGEVRVEMARNAERSEVCLRIADDGSGMPQEAVSRAFEPFFTTKDVGQGTGLGLYIADGIVRGVGGRIEIDSTPSKGTCLNIVLPAAAA